MQRSKFQKKLFLLSLALVVIAIHSTAQHKYVAKGYATFGKVLPHSQNLSAIVISNVAGGELAFELSPDDSKSHWEQFWRFPNIGLGLGFKTLGNSKLLGGTLYAYPYISIPLFSSALLDTRLRLGTGLSYVTKTWYDADTLNGVDAPTANSAFSFPINCYLTSSINLELFLTEQIAITADIGYSHMSNGSFRNPNFGLNMLQMQIGASYRFEPYNVSLRYNPAYGLPFDFEGKVQASAFSRQINYNDNKNSLVASFHAGLTFPIDGWYAIGGGIDLFYDGAFTKRPSDDNPTFNRYKIDNDLLTNKIRYGISINNEIIMGRVTGIIDWGIYLYDPIRNAYPHVMKSRGIFYKYNLKKEDGWNYTRFALRYRVYDNFVVQAGVKMHGYIAEMLEVGVGYLLPFTRDKHSTLNKNLKSYYLYHYNQQVQPAYETPWTR